MAAGLDPEAAGEGLCLAGVLSMDGFEAAAGVFGDDVALEAGGGACLNDADGGRPGGGAVINAPSDVMPWDGEIPAETEAMSFFSWVAWRGLSLSVAMCS